MPVPTWQKATGTTVAQKERPHSPSSANLKARPERLNGPNSLRNRSRHLAKILEANLAALKVYQDLRSHGTQKASVPAMQTRDDLYKYLGYHDYERKLDALFAKTK